MNLPSIVLCLFYLQHLSLVMFGEHSSLIILFTINQIYLLDLIYALPDSYEILLPGTVQRHKISRRHTINSSFTHIYREEFSFSAFNQYINKKLSRYNILSATDSSYSIFFLKEFPFESRLCAWFVFKQF